jgi:hypothetical protein
VSIGFPALEAAGPVVTCWLDSLIFSTFYSFLNVKYIWKNLIWYAIS